MKILHVVRQFHPAIGGLEEAVGQLTANLVGTGEDEVSVVTLDRLFTDPAKRLPPVDRLGDVAITRIPYRGSSRYPLAPAILGHLHGADLVHVHAIDFFFDFLALTRPLHRKPMVVSTHGGFFHTDYAARAKRVWFDTVSRASASAYAAICASSVSDERTFARIAPGRTMLLENGVDVARWHGRGSPTLQPVLLFLGRFSSNKRVPLLFPILRELRRADPAWRLIVAGMESDQSVGDLAKAAAGAGVADAVSFVIGASQAELATVIGEASYIVSASAHEGFGLSIIEGLSAGLHPVLSRIPAFEALAEATGRALLVDVDDAPAAAAAIGAHHRALGARPSMSFLANVQASERYGWALAAERFREVYRRVRTAVRA